MFRFASFFLVTLNVIASADSSESSSVKTQYNTEKMAENSQNKANENAKNRRRKNSPFTVEQEVFIVK